MISIRKRGQASIFPFLLAFSILLGFIWFGISNDGSSRESTTSGSLFRNPIDTGILVLVCGLIGARLGYVLSHIESFSSQPLESIQIWKGGLSWIGAVLGIVIGLLVISLITQVSFWETADVIALPTAIVFGMSWVGCLVDGCAYGHEVTWNLEFLRTPDIFGIEKTRWPSQLLGASLTAAVILILIRLDGMNLRSGSKFLLSTLGITLAITLANLTRGDPGLFIHQIRSDTYVAAIIALFSVTTLLLRKASIGGS